MENKDLTEYNGGTPSMPEHDDEIIQLLKSKISPVMLRERLEDYHENDIAAVMERLGVLERKKLYRLLDSDFLSGIFEYIDADEAVAYLNEMDIHKTADVIARLETDTASEFLMEFEKEKRALIIELLPDDIQKEIKIIASFDDDEIGSKMTANYILINKDLTIKQAMSELVRQAAENDNISTIFVAGEGGVFYGAVDLKDLIVARRDDSLDDITVTSFPYVYGSELIDDCIEMLKDYSENSLPVLDNNNKIIGVITSQSLVEVVDEEMGEDYAKFAGLTAEEDLSEPIGKSVKKRLPWLLVLLALGLAVSAVVGVFEKVIAQLTLIMAFQSLILDMAGNAGTQSLAVTIRVLMDENLTFGQKIHLVTKETKVGFINGLMLGVLSFVLVGLYIAAAKNKTFGFAFSVSGCIGISLLIAMIISSIVGTLIPLFFKKIKVDPAVASGPLITTINDLVAVVTYYGMSWILLLNWLHLG